MSIRHWLGFVSLFTLLVVPTTALAQGTVYVVHGGAIGLPRMVELFTTGPARVLGLSKGRLVAGGEADLTVLDPERRVTVDPDAFASKSRNTPFGSWELRGAPVMTIVGGRIVHDGREQD